jgi:iron complex outermembrane receptor protein
LRLLKQGVRRKAWLALVLGAGAANAVAETGRLAEEGYLGDLPVVLSVTRLAQSLADTPGAVTIIDRDMIRRTGARTVPELLRFVPGFLVSGWNGANAISNYHMRLDEYGARLQVFVDGRSVYSSLYLGDTHRGMAGVVMEDIERIEVLRGSNSAAYGSNAYLGVINIVTRNSADTRGALVSVNAGNGGISDQTLRYGWGTDDASFRISASRRTDDGFKEEHAYPSYYSAVTDFTELHQLHLRGDLRLTSEDDLLVEIGSLRHRTGEGAGTLGNAPFDGKTESSYLLTRWNRQLSATESFSLSATFDDEKLDSIKYEDGTGVGLPILVPVDQGGHSTRTQLEFSHTLQPADSLRTVWGMTWRRETAASSGLFDTDKTYAQNQTRLFGNLEWRMSPQWLLNAGALVERNSVVGSTTAPRLMLNWQPLTEHTFRIGATKATRTPSLFELYGNNPVRAPGIGVIEWEVKAQATAVPERIYSKEVGWLGDFREQRLTVDVRAFRENIRGLLSQRENEPSDAYGTNNYVNAINSAADGLEYQLQWRPHEGTRLWFAQARVRIDPDPGQRDQAIQTPSDSYTAAWFQDLPHEWEMMLMYSHVGTMSWRGETSRLPAYGVANARIAKRFLLGGVRSEAALTVQALGGDHYEFIPPSAMPPGNISGGNPIVPLVQRRAYLTLRMEF